MRPGQWGAAVLLVLMSSATLADEPVTTVTVTAAPISETQARAPTSFATVIDTAEHTEEVETAADALAESVGVSVRRFGGLGAFSTISIRGSSANQVQLYLDGIPLSRARNETVDLGDLPLDSLERIEVYRGSAPIGFGAAGIGGVVNLVTKPPSPTPQTELTASYGSFNTRQVVAAHSQQTHGVDVLGYVTYLGSAGNFTFLNDNGTPLNPADDRTTTRRNNAFNSVEALLEAGTTLAGVRAELTSETFFKDQGVPGIGSHQALDTSLSELRALNYLRLTPSGLMPSSVDLSGTLFGTFERLAFHDLRGELGTGTQDRRDETTLIGGNLAGTYFPFPSQALGWFAELSQERFAPFDALAHPADQPDQTRLHLPLALQHQAGFFGDRFLLVPTARYEHLEDETSATVGLSGQPTGPRVTQGRDLWNPSLGAQLSITPAVSLKGNIGRYERAPNFSELFGNRGGLLGNSSLRPETAINRDIGLVATFGPVAWIDTVHAEYAYFNNDIDDLIVLVQNSQLVSKPINISAARIRGHEVSVRTTLRSHVGVDANYTHQDAEDRSQIPSRRGNQLPGRPADEAYVRLDLFDSLGKVYYEFNLVSGNFLDQANFRRVPSRDTHTLGWAVHPRPPVTVSFEARNVTDNQISDVAGFPLPGRAFFGSVSIKF